MVYHYIHYSLIQVSLGSMCFCVFAPSGKTPPVLWSAFSWENSKIKSGEFPGSSKGFPVSSDGKESAYNVEDLCLIPGSGRSPGEGNGNSF